ncbi:phosphonate metabolism transcriptional regulator PhnF [Polycladidibacter hongkongensis]|uniref:phosphonate metabolism transcriptional regulator PhnF n=1 Tax=Polycladidibacter hongkongensis TaxID=1647556 RepID=UPI001AD8EAB2|nr:phosphonate metabolism transcriptional regulator PhnF [Pseudovibrio hongkongensis]
MTKNAELTFDRLERRTGVAMWRQIAEALRVTLCDGGYGEGTKLPTESVLAESFGVNRHTVRRAISSLVDEGFLRADQGRGTFLARKPLVYPIGSRTRFTENLNAQDVEATGDILGIEDVIADKNLAQMFDCQRGMPLFKVDTLSYGDGVPLIFSSLWFLQEDVPRLRTCFPKHASVTRLLAEHGIDDYRRKDTIVRAVTATPLLAERLQIAEGAAVLVMESINVDLNGKPVQAGLSYVAAQRMHITLSS